MEEQQQNVPGEEDSQAHIQQAKDPNFVYPQGAQTGENGQPDQDTHTYRSTTDGLDEAPESLHTGQNSHNPAASDPSKKPRKGTRNTDSRKSKAYIQTWEKVPAAACSYIDDLLTGFNADSYRFYKHVLNSSSRWTYRDRWVPVPWTVRHKYVRKAEWQALAESGLLEMKGEDRARGKCKEWRIPDPIFSGYNQIAHDNLDGPKVNLFTGNRTEKCAHSERYDEYNNPISQLIRDAISVIQYGLFNKQAVQQHVDRLGAVARCKEAEMNRILEEHGDTSVQYSVALKAYREAEARYSNDLHCYNALLNQQPRLIGNGIYCFKMAYKPQTSGRISHKKGGVQSCSREMKRAVYEGVEDVHNYDIKSSQAYILIDLLEEAGFDASWLQTYVATPKAKKIYADGAGLKVDTWKGCLYAVFMGATVPKNIETSKGDLRAMIEREAGPNLTEVFARFQALIAPLYHELKRWHEYLDTVWVPAKKYAGRGGWFVGNDTGSVFNLNLIKGRPAFERRSKLAAFLLQGKEAAFIHDLTLLAHNFGYIVIANEHDGLVTIGKIPEEAIEIIRQKRSMSYVEIIEKPFG